MQDVGEGGCVFVWHAKAGSEGWRMPLWLGTELGLKHEFKLWAGIPKTVKVLQQPACCFSLRCEQLAKGITRTNLALLSAVGYERGW